MSKRKIYVVGGAEEYANWCEAKIVNHMENADVVLFTGGSDVYPKLYNKVAHPTTSYDRGRDMYEVEMFERAKELGKGMLGICRGAQFLCVMAGGKLVQHQRHPYLHEITTNDGRTFTTSSTHHQRQYIQGLDDANAVLLAWAEHLSPFAFGEDDEDRMDEEKEAEIVYYPKIKALGIQGHPELLYPCETNEQLAFIKYCRELVHTYLE